MTDITVSARTMAGRSLTFVTLAGLLALTTACGPSIDERWTGLQPKSSKASVVSGEAGKLVVDWDASYDNRGKVAKEMSGLFATAGWSERRPAHREKAHEDAFVSRWVKGGEYVDLSLTRDDAASNTQIVVAAISQPAAVALLAQPPWEGVTALPPKESFANPLECALPQPAIFDAEGNAIRKEPRDPKVSWKPNWKQEGEVFLRPGNVQQCKSPRVWRSPNGAAFLCKRNAQSCSHPLLDNRTWVAVLDGGAGADAVSLLGRAAASAMGEAKDHRIIDAGPAPTPTAGVEVRYLSGVDMYERDGDTSQRDHYREMALEVLSTLERDLQLGSITLTEDHGNIAPIVIVAGGTVSSR